MAFFIAFMSLWSLSVYILLVLIFYQNPYYIAC